MRRHAKASSAGSTQRQATGLGRIFRGVAATRGASLTSEGSGAPSARRRAIALSLFAALLGAMALVVAVAGAAAPQVTTEPATNNTGTKATLNGTVNPEGVELDECFFEYGKTNAFGSTIPCAETPAAIGSGTSPVAVHADLTDLQPNGQDYYFKLVAENADGSAEGFSQIFTTPDTVITNPASGVSASAATLNGSVNPDGVPITECLFEWGTTSAYGNTAPCVPNAAGIGSGTSPVAVSADIGGLDLATVYHFRLKAANANGPILGEDETFQTLGPRILGSWSDNVVRTEAEVKAEIDPEGVFTTYRFEWGTDASYGNSTPEIGIGTGSTPQVVSLALDGLAPGATYHYRIVATNSDAVSEGPDRSFTTYEPFVPDTDCPNQLFRTGPGAFLPNCRAYEMVSPVDKGGGGILTSQAGAGGISARASFDQAAVDGSRITYTSAVSFGDSPSNRRANQYLARRGAEGWMTHSIDAPRDEGLVEHPTATANAGPWNFFTPFEAFTDDLASAWVRDANKTPLIEDAAEGFANIYRRDTIDGTYHDPVITSEPLLFSQEGGVFSAGRLLGDEVAERSLELKGRSRDGSRLVIRASAQLTPDAPANLSSKVYEYSNGELDLVSVLPDGTPYTGHAVPGVIANDLSTRITAGGNVERAVSEDGSRIFWTAQTPGGSGLAGDLYVRIDGTTTVAVSGSVSPNPARFWTASTDGSKVAFTIVESSSEDFLRGDLYEFDVDTETPTLIAHDVQGVAGASEDLSYLYFLSEEDLDAGAIAGEQNLYVRHEGTIAFIGTLSEFDTSTAHVSEYPSIVNPSPRQHGARVTPDGRHLAFMSDRSLTGYDNTDAVDGEPDAEVFLYDAVEDELTCVSCNPSGARPHGGGTAAPYTFGKREDPASPWRTAAWIQSYEQELYGANVLRDDGKRLYFNAVDALLPQDTNGVNDVYQWEAPGSGSCDLTDSNYFERNEGCISLISTGKNPAYSEFIDASADGSSVFIRTESDIDPRDPGLMDIYVAREGGGFPPPPPPPPPCEGDACQDVPEPPVDPTPASASFRGVGDPVPSRNCGAAAKRAGKLSRQAKSTQRKAKRVRGAKRAKQLRRRSIRFAKRAKRMSRSAKRCRRANRGAGR